MMTELVIVKEAGILTSGIIFMNLYVPDTVTRDQIARGQVVDRGGDTLMGSAHGHGEVAETCGFPRHELGDGRLNVGADRGSVLLTMAYRQPSRAALLSKFQSMKSRENSNTPNINEIIGIMTRAVSTATAPRLGRRYAYG